MHCQSRTDERCNVQREILTSRAEMCECADGDDGENGEDAQGDVRGVDWEENNPVLGMQPGDWYNKKDCR